MQSNLVWLTIIGVVNSAVAAYYYLRLIVVMYMREQTIDAPPDRVSPAMGLALVLAAIGTIYLGVLPGYVLDSATHGALALSPKSPTAYMKVEIKSVIIPAPPATQTRR